MSLNAATLGTAFKAAFVANGAADNAATTSLCNALAAAVVAHILANAVVDPAGAVPMNVVVAGTPTPVLGTGKIT